MATKSFAHLGSPRSFKASTVLHSDHHENTSTASTPFVSAPSSPRNATNASMGFYSNLPTSPSRPKFDVKTSATTGMSVVVPRSWHDRPEAQSWHDRPEAQSWHDRTETQTKEAPVRSIAGTNESEEYASFSMAGSDFDFSARFSEADGHPWSPAAMSSADELFYNGQIRPLRLFPPVEPQQTPVKKSSVSDSDDGYVFDFRSSANYTLSAPHSPRSPPKQDPKKARAGHTKPAAQTSTPALEQWKKIGRASKQRVAVDDPMKRGRAATPRTAANEPTRRDRDGGHRRTRSLSPLRVFHIDDQPRQSCESEDFYSVISSIDCKDPCKASPRRSRGWTLRDLLHVGDSKVHDRENPRRCTESSSHYEKASRSSEQGAGTKAQGTRKLRGAPTPIVPPTRSSKNALRSPREAVSPHELHYTSQRAQAEQMRKRTFLPYRQGLLGCLGFSSKSYRSVAGIHTLNGKS